MTKEQALQIRTLRKQGMGYRTISNIVNLSRDSIRNYCRTHGLAGHRLAYEMNLKDRIDDGTACEYCGAPLKRTKAGRPRRFCSELCRRNYWNAHRDEVSKDPKAVYIVECKYCGKIFESYGNKNRKYCCHEHYILDRFGDKATSEDTEAAFLEEEGKKDTDGI